MELQQVMSKRDEQQMLDPNMYAPQEVAPLAQQKGMVGQMGDMVKQKAMQSALTAGTEGLTAAGTSALGGSAMAGIGTAMPYVGAGMLAGKALGLFNAGGQVGPLNAQYHAEGTGALKTPEMESLLEELAYKDYIEAFSDRLGAYQTGTLDSGKYSAGGPISPQYHAEGTGAMKTPGMEKLLEGLAFDELYKQEYGNASLQNFLNQHNIKNINELDVSKLSQGGPISAQYKAQGGMTKEQAMALMNNQPEPMRENPYDRLLAQSMTEGAIGTPEAMGRPRPVRQPLAIGVPRPVRQSPLSDPLKEYKLEGRDRTYNPYDMIRPDNAPNT